MLKLRLGILFYGLIIFTMGYALEQLANTPILADEIGVCCSTSYDCPGTQICTRPPNSAPCCDPAVHTGCKGPSYCRDTFGD